MLKVLMYHEYTPAFARGSPCALFRLGELYSGSFCHFVMVGSSAYIVNIKPPVFFE